MNSEKIYQKLIANNNGNDIYRPIFFKLTNVDEKNALEKLLEEQPHIKIFDTMWAQLKELVKSKKPSLSLSMEEIESDILSHLNGGNMTDYGVWVYYPWADRVVHTLDEEEFISMRTNRNNYKITKSEQAKLFQKKVGVIGLSVGQSVSLTMAI